jgi:hypothetical protein
MGCDRFGFGVLGDARGRIVKTDCPSIYERPRGELRTPSNVEAVSLISKNEEAVSPISKTLLCETFQLTL